MCAVGGWGPMFGTKSQINPVFFGHLPFKKVIVDAPATIKGLKTTFLSLWVWLKASRKQILMSLWKSRKIPGYPGTYWQNPSKHRNSKLSHLWFLHRCAYIDRSFPRIVWVFEPSLPPIPQFPEGSRSYNFLQEGSWAKPHHALPLSSHPGGCVTSSAEGCWFHFIICGQWPSRRPPNWQLICLPNTGNFTNASVSAQAMPLCRSVCLWHF